MTVARSLVTAAGGALLVLSLFLPWAEVGGADRTGWELWTSADVVLLMAAVVALAAAVAGGRYGLLRPDVSFIGAADLLGVTATVLVAWLLLVDLPDGADAGTGAYLGLLAAMAIAGGAGDYRVLRGAPAFPRLER